MWTSTQLWRPLASPGSCQQDEQGLLFFEFTAPCVVLLWLKGGGPSPLRTYQWQNSHLAVAITLPPPLPSPKESSLLKEKGDITLLRVLSGFLKMSGFGQQVKRKPSSLCILTCYMPLFFLPSCCYDASVQSPEVRNQFQSGNLPLVCLYVCRSCRYVPVLSIKLLSFLYWDLTLGIWFWVFRVSFRGKYAIKSVLLSVVLPLKFE